MNLIFMRYGEATDNVAGLISDKEIYYGKYSHQKNNFELDQTRKKNIR